jgi:RimJ/RimL family protein N-acetyltransferase
MSLVVRPLHAGDAPALAAMLQSQPDAYMRYFIPFQFDVETIETMLMNARRDLYMGMFWEERLAGFFMLRGWDAGYAVPAYGVTISQEFSAAGLGKLSLETSKTVCRLRGATRLMLKVHPENIVARHIYERAGFVQTGIDPKNDNLVYHFDFTPAP